MHDRRRRRRRLGQGASGREFSGRLAAHSCHAIARRSSPFTTSCARPTTSPTIRRLRRRRSSRCSTARSHASGRSGDEPVAGALRAQLAARQLSPRHALDLLDAFRMDATKLRYRDWDDLMTIAAFRPCRSDASCSMCTARAARPGRQRRVLRRVADHQSPAGLRRGLSQSRPRLYAARRSRAAGAGVEALGAARASPALLALPPRARRAHRAICCARAEPFSPRIDDTRLALEVAVIQRLARAPRRDC